MHKSINGIGKFIKLLKERQRDRKREGERKKATKVKIDKFALCSF